MIQVADDGVGRRLAYARSMMLAPRIAAELSLPERKVAAAARLFGEGNTVPFVARYRKEATGGLDEVQLRAIAERLTYLGDLDKRRAAIVESLEQQGALTAELRAAIDGCATKAELEDLYRPYRKKRRTRAQQARERGLGPLADRILAQPRGGDPRAEAAAFIDPEKGVADVDAALAGARDIAAELMAEAPAIRADFRRHFSERGVIASRAARGKKKVRSKFEQYYDFREPVAKLPSHRYLAIRRGEEEGFLKASIEIDEKLALAALERHMKLERGSPFAGELRAAIAEGFSRLLAPGIETEVRGDLKERSDRAAVDVFAENLEHLLLAAPFGGEPVIGIDPGLRTGCKCAAVDATGKFCGDITIYLAGKSDDRAAAALCDFVGRHKPAAIAIGNGTGGRETEAFVRRLIRDGRLDGCFAVSVSEAGASVYSASELAGEELAGLDVTVRGAVSIARRLQDPLAELVKVEPKAIGVGQYQHDVDQKLLARKLGEVVESCVNRVGVELNTSSAALLAHVAGVGASLAKKIVAHRDRNGAFTSRRALLDVSGLGPRAFEQAAGFVRVSGSAQPLDASAVHPERYALVERIAADLGTDVAALVGDRVLAERIDPAGYVSDGVGEPTLRDIIAELARPGRDPRASFEPPAFRDDVNELSDLAPGMRLEGVVTNVTAFGAFVDVGVHQDGLVHISKLADRFVRDPAEVVKVGEKIQVTVLDVDLERMRISLSARREDAGKPPKSSEAPKPSKPSKPSKPQGSFGNNPFAKLRGK
jgi:uncharacterized protein